MKRRRLVLATGNTGKLAEFSALLADVGIECLPQSALGIDTAHEDGLSFIENAIIKARHASHQSGLPAIADDSGLEVEGLHGAPGIHSSRYAGPDANDADNVRKLLGSLDGLPPEDRRARFVCVVVFMRHAEDPVPIVCQGYWNGRIAESSRGDGGFGYDPIFIVDGLDRTAAELTAPEKNRLSHRAQALQHLRDELRRIV